MPSSRWQLEITCVDCRTREQLRALELMEDHKMPIHYATLKRVVGVAALTYAFPRYVWGAGNKPGIRMHQDYAICCYRSVWDGKECYVVDHSRIDHIFTEVNHG
jgi:hypothetical protein